MYIFILFFVNDTAPTEIYTLSLHDALPISARPSPYSGGRSAGRGRASAAAAAPASRSTRTVQPASTVSVPSRSEEDTSGLQSPQNLVWRLLLVKKKPTYTLLSRTPLNNSTH